MRLADSAVDIHLADPAGLAVLGQINAGAADIGLGLVNALPPVFLIPSHMDNPIHGVVALLSRELTQAEPGRQTVLDRLLDVLVVLGLRTGLASSPHAPAWVRGASDARLSKALQAMHGDTGKPWTVEELARMSHMSRATFARVF